MADRSVVVRLRADIAQYQAAMMRAKGVTTEFGREVSGQGKTARADVEAVGRSALVVGGAMAIGFGKAIQVGMGFEKQMSGVQAVSGATAEEMTKLSDAALAAGASTKLAGVTASDAAAAEAELVKAGVSVSDVLGGALMGSLTLAAAGQIDFANAATIAAQAMNIFDLRGGAVTHVADVLAAAANKSASDVGSLGDALRQGGLVASQYGLSLETTVGTLAAFSDNALVGSDAGTALKTMLQRLSPISKESASLMEEIGFNAYDAQGNFIGLAGVAEELRTSLDGMTQQQRDTTMAQLFGSDAVRGATVLYELGADGVKEYTDAVNDEGAAARMAAIQNDNLAGDVEALGGALESALIENGSKATDVLRFLTQGATDMVSGFSAMPDLLQGGAMGLGAVVTAGTLAVGVIGTMAPKVERATEALGKMGVLGPKIADNLGKMAGAVGVAGAGFAAFAAWEAMMANAAASADEAAVAWKSLAFGADNTESLDDFSAALKRVNEEERKLRVEANASDAPWDADKRAEMRAGADELGNIGTEMARTIDLAAELARTYGLTRDAALEFVLGQRDAGVDLLAEDYESVVGAMGTAFTETRTGTTATQRLAVATETLGSEVASVEDQVKAFADTLDALQNQFFGIEAAEDAFQSSLNELPDVLKEAADEGLNLNDVLSSQSDEAITVRGHMRGMISDAADMIAEWQEQGITGEELAGKIYMLSQSFRDQAIAAGVPVPVVDHYLSLLDAIPISKDTAFNANTATAEEKIAALMRSISLVPTSLPINFIGPTLPGQVRTAGPVQTRASGGDFGPGWLLTGEDGPELMHVGVGGTVLNASETQSAFAGGFSGMSSGGGVTIINRVTVSAGNIIGDHGELVRVVKRGLDEAARLTAA